MAPTDICRKDSFFLPEGMIYLDGNSLGPLPKAVSKRVANTIEEQWGKSLIGGWNSCGWMDQPSTLGDRVGRLIGAPEGSTVMGDTLSIKVYQAVASALDMRPQRKVILSDTGNFPTDLYMAKGLIDSLDQDHELRVVEPDAIAEAIDETVAIVMLTHVDYRTGRMHDMGAITKAAHAAGAVMIWDLAHSAGAVPVDLAGCACEFAVGCTYKYLNGGPGAPAFIYARPDIAPTLRPALAGWLGHDAPFAFDLDYRPAPGIDRMRVGTPPVLQMASLEAAMDVWDGVNMDNLRAASIELSETFIAEVERRCPHLTLESPREPSLRGSQVSFSFQHGYAAMQAVIARGVIGDFRAPNIMRFGFTPLYIDKQDVLKAVAIIEDVMSNRLWDDPKYQKKGRVT
ncbi:kynureninase [Pseudahrensia aquimaris]|uniref:Kynureninase n=1 Tax=Pseudahrensia aquimaris TaxID=744461 RepID=A0ABW3FFW8_9HYPH